MAALQSFGIVGMEVMGKNIALNIEEKGFPIAVYNRTTSKADEFLAENPGKNIKVGHSPEEFVKLLEKPRRILLMVKAGFATDSTIKALQPFLEKDDILIDGGNALYTDTERRENELRPTGIKFFGMGVSGGEEGARHGPSIMPGGDRQSYEELKPVLEKIAAKAPSDGVPCVTYCGERSAGHFVKMVHNGIEYGDMQLIAEAYDLLKNVAGLNNDQLYDVFGEWNSSELQSFLIEISQKVIKFPDPTNPKQALVEQIRDVVGMKGTGTWTIKAGLDMLVPLPTMASAVDMREISSLKDERIAASKKLAGPKPKPLTGDTKALVKQIKDALYCSKICSYAQGMALLAAANRSKEEGGHGYKMTLPDLPMIWRAGCIIRAVFLEEITQAFKKNPKLPNLLMDDKFSQMVADREANWRAVIKLGIDNGIGLPAFSSSIAYYDSYRRERMPGNLIQAQRDFFGAHTYERTEKPGTFIHTEWSPAAASTVPTGSHGATQVGTLQHPKGD